jgi:hypothetical protein
MYIYGSLLGLYKFVPPFLGHLYNEGHSIFDVWKKMAVFTENEMNATYTVCVRKWKLRGGTHTYHSSLSFEYQW